VQINELYKSSLDQIKPSVLEIIFDGDWNSRSDILIESDRSDSMKIFKKRYNECAGDGWPSFKNFITGNVYNISTNILKEIEVDFDFVTWRTTINQRRDQHPVPDEHLEYLEKIGFPITERQRSFAHYWNQRVLLEKKIGWKSQPVKRF
jgi:hypothetical protein